MAPPPGGAIGTYERVARLSCCRGPNVGRRAYQCDGTAVAHELWQLRVVAITQREHVAVAFEHDRLPPPVVMALLRDDEMAGCDVLEGSRQALGGRAGGLLQGRLAAG